MYYTVNTDSASFNMVSDNRHLGTFRPMLPNAQISFGNQGDLLNSLNSQADDKNSERNSQSILHDDPAIVSFKKETFFKPK